MCLLESFHIFVFLLDTVLVKLINFRRAKNAPAKISKTLARNQDAQTHILRGKSAGEVVVRQSPMTVGPMCVQIIYSLTEILKEIFACYVQNRCVITLLTRLTSDLGSVFCLRGAIRLPTIDMSSYDHELPTVKI